MNKVLSGVMALALLGGWCGIASASGPKCSDVSIVVLNQYIGNDGYEKEIKVVDLDYWDDQDGKWRSETTSNHQIAFNATYTYTKNLSDVGGEPGVKIRIYYKVFANGSWGDTQTRTSSAFECNDGDAVWITID